MMSRGKRYMGRNKTDNRGFSLVELIITVAIMSLLIGVTSYGLSLSSGKPAEECARKLASALQHGRTSTMGKYRNTITITKNSSGIVVEEEMVIKIEDDGTEQHSERTSVVGNKAVTIKYSTDGSSIKLRFDSGSGALKKNASGDYYTGFELSKAGTTKHVTIEPLTGRVSTD
jgi:prepilin-type N-terminal cleavage/methylation domain-containing protein